MVCFVGGGFDDFGGLCCVDCVVMGVVIGMDVSLVGNVSEIGGFGGIVG